MANLFERLSGTQPPPAQPEEKDHRHDKRRRDEEAFFAAQRLLDFLQKWAKPTIRVRDIRIFGPYALRNQESAINAAEALTREGWLIRTQTHQHNMHEWQIVRP